MNQPILFISKQLLILRKQSRSFQQVFSSQTSAHVYWSQREDFGSKGLVNQALLYPHVLKHVPLATPLQLGSPGSASAAGSTGAAATWPGREEGAGRSLAGSALR